MISTTTDPVACRQESSESPGAAHLVFLIDSQPFACRAADVSRLLLLSDAQVLPSPAGAPAWEAGRLQISGLDTGVPIISLRRFWGVAEPAVPSALGKQSLLVVQVSGATYALLADACQCVLPSLPQKAMSLRLPKPLTGTRGSAFTLAVQWNETLLVIMDVNHLLPARPRAKPGLQANNLEST